MERIKWKIIGTPSIEKGKLKLTVEFYWGYERVPRLDEEGNHVVIDGVEQFDYTNPQSQREFLESPVLPTSDQVVNWLNNEWSLKYAQLEAYEAMISGLTALTNYTQNY